MGKRRTIRQAGAPLPIDATNLRLLAAIAAGFGLASACGGRADSGDGVGPAPNTPGQAGSPAAIDPPSNPPSNPYANPYPDPTPADMPAPPELLPPREGELCYAPAEFAELNIPAQVRTQPGVFDANGCLSGDYSGVLAFGSCLEDPDGAVLRQGGQCCYVLVDGPPGCGRPLVVDGRKRRASPSSRSSRVVAAQEPATAAVAIGRQWLQDALLEHASIASFSLFGLSLMALGAPLELVAECQRAVADEVEHARACFRLAARYGAEHSAAGPLDLSSVNVSTDLAEIALRTLLDGCVEETIASLTARAQLDVATDAEVQRVLARIAEDELRHAELGWKFVAWALTARDPRVLRALRDVRKSLEGRTPAELSLAGPSAHAIEAEPTREQLHAAGRLTPSEQQLVRARALSLVIVPALDTLIAH